MAHSNRLHLHGLLVVIEVGVFAGAVATGYFSQKNDWNNYFSISAVLVLLFVALKVFQEWPTLRELLVKEDFAAELANSAVKYGVVKYFNMQSAAEQTKRNDATRAAIRNATGLWLCANSGASYLDHSIYRHWDAVVERLNQNIEFRVVLLDPFSKEKEFRSRLNIDGEQADSRMNLPNLVNLYNRYPSLEIRFAPHGMHATVFATNEWLFFDPYHMGVVNNRVENRSFCLQIERATPMEGVGLFTLFKSHFDNIWRSSMSFEDWLDQQREQLPRDIPRIVARYNRD